MLMLGAVGFHIDHVRSEGSVEQQVIVINVVLGRAAFPVFIGHAFNEPLA